MFQRVDGRFLCLMSFHHVGPESYCRQALICPVFKTAGRGSMKPASKSKNPNIGVSGAPKTQACFAPGPFEGNPLPQALGSYICSDAF